MCVLSEVAQQFDVDPAVFTDAMRMFPNSNELEMAVSGLKRAASRCARNKDRAGFDRIVTAVRIVGDVSALEKHFAGLSWA